MYYPDDILFIPFQELAHSITPFYKKEYKGRNGMCLGESGKFNDDVLAGVK